MVKPFEDASVVGVQGAYRSSQTEWMARFSQIEIEDRYRRMSRSESIDFIGTYAAAYRRDVFFRHGLFDTRFVMASGEDADFSFRLAGRGMRMVFQPEAIVYHRHPTTLSRYLRQKYWRAYWRNLIYRKHFSKVWKDSYTPFSLKVQTIFGLIFPFSFLGLCVGFPWNTLPLIMAAGIFIASLPFTFYVGKKDPSMVLWIPMILLLRTVVLSAGTAHGAIKGLWLKGD
jgi:GT2 family glycosyltransferase